MDCVLPFCSVAVAGPQPPTIVRRGKPVERSPRLRQYAPEPRSYELMTVLSPDVPDGEIAGVLERISGYVTDAGGTMREVLNESPWGRRRLAYPIRHGGRDVRDGYYTVYHFDLVPGQVVDVERELKLNDQIIRYLLVQYTPPAQPEEAPAAAAAPEAEGEATQPSATAAEQGEPQGGAGAEPQAPPAPEPPPAEATQAVGEAVAAGGEEPHEGNGTETVAEGPGGDENPAQQPEEG